MLGIYQNVKCTVFSTLLDKRAHILYICNEMDQYIANAVNFMIEGLEKGEMILFVETEEIIGKVKDAVKSLGQNPEKVIFMNGEKLYLAGDQFDVNSAEKLNHLLQPYFEKGYTVRTWGSLPIPEHESTLSKIRIYECNCEEFICQRNMISVCVYNGFMIPAYVQNELLRTHTHLMTDHELSESPLYNRKHFLPPSGEEMERLHRLEKQNRELRSLNNQLTIENHLFKFNNELILQSEKKVRKIFDQLPIPTIIRRNNEILYLNCLAKEQFSIGMGYIEKENQLRSFFEDYAQTPSSFDAKTEQHPFRYENGKVRHYLVNSIDLMYEGEISILHSFVDITHEKENEMLLIRSEKMNIVGELAASIAHELRNPLTAIKGFFQMLKDAKDEKEMYFNVIETELSRVEQISSELLSLSKPHSDNKKEYDILQLIDDVIILLRPQANMKNIKLILETDYEELNLFCEGTKIKQVFINLIKNAIDAMDDAGSIRIHVKESNEKIVIQIIDQGCGIPKEIMDKIGEPFYTTKEKGTGLGLMVCFQIIENHNGTLHVESKTNIGTTFTITVPGIRDKNGERL